MNAAKLFEPTFSAIATLLGAMAVVAAIETRVPLHPRGYWNRAHLKPGRARGPSPSIASPRR
jgi:hypothetical protein